MGDRNEWTDALLPLLTLALVLEREGHYSLAKLARAAVDSLGRRAAFQNEPNLDKTLLGEEIRKSTELLSQLDVSEDLLAAFHQGAAALAEGRLALLKDAPHPYVCRTCGHMLLGEATEKCPLCGSWPDTFQWFAPIYWLDALDPFAALEQLRQTPVTVAALLEGLPEQAMELPPPEAGWNLRNVLSHLRDAQGVLAYRLELFEKETHPVLESRAVFAWATREEEHRPSALDIFSAYRFARCQLIARLERIPLADWWRTGFHEEFGTVSIKQQVSYFAAHERTHLPQIERLRAQYLGSVG